MLYEQLMLAHYERITREGDAARSCELAYARLPLYLPWRQRWAQRLRALAEWLEPTPSAPSPVPQDLWRPAFSAKTH